MYRDVEETQQWNSKVAAAGTSRSPFMEGILCPHISSAPSLSVLHTLPPPPPLYPAFLPFLPPSPCDQRRAHWAKSGSEEVVIVNPSGVTRWLPPPSCALSVLFWVTMIPMALSLIHTFRQMATFKAYPLYGVRPFTLWAVDYTLLCSLNQLKC